MDVCLRIDNSGINSSHVMSSVVEKSHKMAGIQRWQGESRKCSIKLFNSKKENMGGRNVF
jgi:hypothetical protein